MQPKRIDQLPLDRRVGHLGPTGGQLPALFERRDVEPGALTLTRRTGTQRSTSDLPNLLGAGYDGELGECAVDRDFDSEIGSEWTIFGTFYAPDSTLSSDSYSRVFSLNGTELYVKHLYATNQIRLQVYDDAGSLLTQTGTVSLSLTRTLRFMVAREAAGNVALNGWAVPASGGTAVVGADVTAAHTFDDTLNELVLFGEVHSSLAGHYKGVLLTNFLLYDADVFTTAVYDAFAADLTPETSITLPGASDLLWQGKFSEGGTALTYTNDGAEEVNAYLVPSKPLAYDPAGNGAPTEIHFGGKGVLEVPFYLDFDEYYWTATYASARLEWCFQLEITTPEILAACTIYEVQDLLRLRIVESGGSYYLKAEFHNATVSVTHTTALAGGTAYDVFAARDTTTVYLKQDAAELNATATNPIIFNYDKTLGFVIGDTADFENSEPYSGRLGRFALHNSSTRAFGDRTDAVIYYDVDSIYGDEVLDRGPRSLNGYLGVRSSAKAPYYAEGAFPGGAYVAAAGGYLISAPSPSYGYEGTLEKPLLKDAVVQREGQRAFVVSNGVAYLVDDVDETFRPLGIPRPSTKVSCTPQGIGAIDGFVRYAYRYTTQDGTVGPVFQLDPCDATGGVNVLLGAETFSLPLDPAFGIAYGECEVGTVAADGVECLIAHDDDNTGDADPSLLHIEKKNPGLTLETAFRLPALAAVTEESVISQGVYAPFGPTYWFADHTPYNFPWIGGQGAESTFQLTFRYFYDAADSNTEYQILFGIGARNQHKDGSPKWRLNHLLISIQPPENVSNDHSLVITRDDAYSGSGHYNDALKHWSKDYDFVSGNDYTIFVSRGGANYGSAPGADLLVAIYDHTAESWNEWPHSATATQLVNTDFWGANYTGKARDEVVWGGMRREGSSISTKTRKRSAAGSSTFNFDFITPLFNGTTSDGSPGTVLYHGRMWRKEQPFTLLAEKALDRYGARQGPLSDALEVDVAFCSDSSKPTLDGGWDFPNDMRVKFATPHALEARVFLGSSVDKTVFLAYGADNTITAGSPDTHAVTSTDQIPLWAAYTSRNKGSIVVGVGQAVSFEIGKQKWHSAAEVLTFSELSDVIDLKQWTWLTLYFHQINRVGATNKLDIWLERIFLDGNTGEWGDVFDADVDPEGPDGKANNTAAGNGQFSLMTVGGVPGIDSDFEVEIAEVRLWDGERYTAAGGGDGEYAFGTYLSTRIPPNIWDELHVYLRFAPADLDDPDSPTTMDQVGTFGGQKNADAVDVYQGADIISGDDVQDDGSHYFVPFPVPPLDSIKGIQIFRTQVVPVTETYDNGKPNPNAITDAYKAALAAPLYLLTEIPDGTDFYFDAATDDLLGGKLDLTEGLIPTNPGGIFEWAGHLGLWVTDRPRIHFAAAPGSWESYPADMVYDLPLRESGQIQAAVELGAQDARSSRALVLGRAWGVFLEGNPTSPQVNSIGGGVGAASSRCLVIEGGVAYAYNGTLWAINGAGEVTDIGRPVLDLLPDPDNARLSVSSALKSVFVIDESTGITLRYYLPLREWFVEDRYALSVTDIDGVDSWVHLSGYPAAGTAAHYSDDTDSDTATEYAVSSFVSTTLVIADTTGISAGQRLTVAAEEDPRRRQTLTVQSVADGSVVVEETITLSTTGPDVDGNTITYTYLAHPGVGPWGTMIDTGPFVNSGFLDSGDIGVVLGDQWYAGVEGVDYYPSPTDLSGFLDNGASFPARVVDSGDAGASARWGINNRQRIQRVILWSPAAEAATLSEVHLNHTHKRTE